MELPKLDAPTYELSLPSTKKKIRYRPFLVKEEKILLMANEGDDTDEQIMAVKQILTNCIISPKVNIEKLSTFDIEYLFVNIRAKSVGNIVSLSYKKENCVGENDSDPKTCQIPFSVNLDEVSIERTKSHSNKIDLNDDVGVVMKYPDFKTMARMQEISDVDDVLSMIIDCIEFIYQGEEIYNTKDYGKDQLAGFLESLTQNQFDKINEFFETMPSVYADANVKCSKCGWETSFKLKGISDFFE